MLPADTGDGGWAGRQPAPPAVDCRIPGLAFGLHIISTSLSLGPRDLKIPLLALSGSLMAHEALGMFVSGQLLCFVFVFPFQM